MSFKKKFTTIALLGTATAATIHIINKAIEYSATLYNYLAQPEGNYYDWRFGKIFYTKQGEGSPILLIHDLDVSSSSYEWNAVVSTLSKINTVYTLDLLGCGRSDKPNLTYTNFLYVQLITDFIKHIIKEKTDVISTGASGSFTIMACANDNDIFNKIMLVNPASLIELAKIPTKRTKMLKHIINLPIIGTLIYNITVAKNMIEENFEENYFYDNSKIDSKAIDTYYEAAHNKAMASKFLFASIQSRYTNANIIHCLKNINNSIFIITGNGNPLNEAFADQYANQIPAIEVFGIENTKYLPQLEAPTAFIEQVDVLFELSIKTCDKEEISA
ncbi:MAG: alpha/beta fold hydrolase [Lachnospiraceae bacterium]|nr:alpha/beta fold hydrolase [Lachnospiraceae bacterium]